MKFLLSVLCIFGFLIGASLNLNCNEEAVCLTFPKESLQSYCASFLKVPCPVSCGKCASEKLKMKFAAAFDVNADAKITLEEAQNALKLINVNMEEALVTEIKDIILDTKTALLDIFSALDLDKDSIVTINELFLGIINLTESFGAKIKPEMKQTLLYVADILQVDSKNPLVLPKAQEAVDLITKKIQAYPHGLVSLVRLQNLTQNKFDFERIITTQQLSYTINSKMLLWSFLDKVDKDEDDFISVREFVNAVLFQLQLLDINIPNKANENVFVFVTMLESAVKTLLNKYGLTDASLLDGKPVSELNNQKFVDQRIRMREAVSSVRTTFSSVAVMKYLKVASNGNNQGIPQKKLTSKSIIEATFISADKNKDYELDFIEFSDLVLVVLSKINAGLQDYTEAIKVAKLFDYDHNDKISMSELIDMLRLEPVARSL